MFLWLLFHFLLHTDIVNGFSYGEIRQIFLIKVDSHISNPKSSLILDQPHQPSLASYIPTVYSTI